MTSVHQSIHKSAQLTDHGRPNIFLPSTATLRQSGVQQNPDFASRFEPSNRGDERPNGETSSNRPTSTHLSISPSYAIGYGSWVVHDTCTVSAAQGAASPDHPLHHALPHLRKADTPSPAHHPPLHREARWRK